MAIQEYIEVAVGEGLPTPREVLAGWPGLLLVSVLSIAVLVAGRMAVAPLLNDPIVEVTWIGLAGGFLGGVMLAAILDVGIERLPGETVQFRALQLVHILYGALAGAFMPAVYWRLFAPEARWIISLPEALHAGQSYGLLMFVVAATAYLAVGTLGGPGENFRQWGALLGMYVMYGVFFGMWMGLTEGVWFVLLGVR